MSRMAKLLNARNPSSGGRVDDKKFYYPERDKAGNGSAIIRFLPGKTDDDIPFVKTYSHGFKGATGKWFIEDCPTTIGEPCFCCEQNSALIAPFGGWVSTPNNVKETVRERKRKMQYIANVLVIKDEKNPDNEGKVFLFKFGQKVAEKVFNMIAPTFVDEDEKDEFVKKFGAESVDVFDLAKGANFHFKIRKVEGQTNYDKSEFKSPSAVDVAVDLNEVEDLAQFTAKTHFKGAEDLEKSYNRAVGNTNRVAPVAEVAELAPAARPAAKPTAKAPAASTDDDGDDVMAMMAKLAAEDGEGDPF